MERAVDVARSASGLVEIWGGGVTEGVGASAAELGGLIGGESFDGGEAFAETGGAETGGGFGGGVTVTDGGVTTATALGLVVGHDDDEDGL